MIITDIHHQENHLYAKKLSFENINFFLHFWEKNLLWREARNFPIVLKENLDRRTSEITSGHIIDHHEKISLSTKKHMPQILSIILQQFIYPTTYHQHWPRERPAYLDGRCSQPTKVKKIFWWKHNHIQTLPVFNENKRLTTPSTKTHKINPHYSLFREPFNKFFFGWRYEWEVTAEMFRLR